MRNGIVPLAGASRDFAEREFSGGVGGIEFQLLLKFFLGLRGVGLRLAFRERDAPEAEVNAWHARILVKDFLIFGGGLLPAVLRLVGTGSFLRELLRRSRGQLGEIMCGDVEDFGIAREVALQEEQRVDRALLLIEAHGALRNSHGGAIFELLVGGLLGGWP